MCEYHEMKITSGQSARTEVQSRAEPRFLSLAQQYGYNDDMQIGGSNQHSEQTVEHEYQAYVTAPRSLGNVDLLKFWEVSCSLANHCQYSHIFAGQCRYFSNYFLHGHGLPSNSGISSAM